MSDAIAEAVDALFDRRSSAAQVAQLERELRSSSAARADYWRQVRLHADLRDALLEQRGQLSARMRLGRRVSWRLPLAAAILACAMIAAAWIAFAARSRAPLLTEVVGAVTLTHATSAPAVVGARVADGDAIEAAAGAHALVRWPDGTATELIGGRLTVEASSPAKRLSLHSGRVDATVAKQPLGHPLIIVTPTARAEVVGTRFTLTVDDDGTALAVAAGSVRVIDAADGAMVTVAAGGSHRSDAGLRVQPGDDLAQQVASHPPGTTFRIAAGIHRLQAIIPKDGDRFIGDAGAVLCGARELHGFEVKDGGWSIADAESDLAAVDAMESEGRITNAGSHDLFIDGWPLRQVLSADQLMSSCWYADPAGRIRIADDPTGRTIELSVAHRAFDGPANAVEIRGLAIEKYATPTSSGAVGGTSAGAGWTVRDCDIRLNHASAVWMRDGWSVSGCRIAGNGECGLHGSGAGMRVEDCEITGNFRDNPANGGAAAGGVWDTTAGFILRGNRIHDNRGVGLLLAGGDRGAICERNVVTDNRCEGIVFQHGAGGAIRANQVSGNGSSDNHWGGQILLLGATGCEVCDNRVRASAATGGNGICVLIYQSGAGTVEPSTANSIHDNDIEQRGVSGVCYEDQTIDMSSNRFDRNRYRVPDPSGRHWMWLPRTGCTWDEFRSAGQEAHGTVERTGTP